MNATLRILALALYLIDCFPISAQAQNEVAPMQQGKTFQKKIVITAKLDYLVSLPAEYGRSRELWPLMLFLHGSGESGTDLAKVKTHGPPKIVETNGPFPFILISPQSPNYEWNTDKLNAFLDAVLKEYRVDKDRVYLTGLSQGGYGAWALAAAHPEKFAAVAPLCGGGYPPDAKKLARLPIWVFHGAKDTVVPLQESKDMVEALQAAGAQPKFTIYPEADHDCWTETYNNPEFYQWLLSQSRNKLRSP